MSFAIADAHEAAAGDPLGRGRRRRRNTGIIATLAVVLVVSMVVGAAVGPIWIEPLDVFRVMGAHLSGSGPASVIDHDGRHRVGRAGAAGADGGRRRCGPGGVRSRAAGDGAQHARRSVPAGHQLGCVQRRRGDDPVRPRPRDGRARLVRQRLRRSARGLDAGVPGGPRGRPGHLGPAAAGRCRRRVRALGADQLLDLRVGLGRGRPLGDVLAPGLAVAGPVGCTAAGPVHRGRRHRGDPHRVGAAAGRLGDRRRDRARARGLADPVPDPAAGPGVAVHRLRRGGVRAASASSAWSSRTWPAASSAPRTRGPSRPRRCSARSSCSGPICCRGCCCSPASCRSASSPRWSAPRSCCTSSVACTRPADPNPTRRTHEPHPRNRAVVAAAAAVVALVLAACGADGA